MKIRKVGWLVMVLTVMVFNLSSCSAWFGIKHKNGRNSILPGEGMSSRSTRLMNPAGSSIVFPLHGNVYPVGFYNVTLNIGQPPRPYFLDVDTGSDLTWLQCDAPCSHCSETPHPLYRPSNDFVPCKDPLCASLQPSDEYTCEDPNQCDYEIEYADHYSTLGVLLNDVYLLNFTMEFNLKFGWHLDGVLGLGRGKASLISQLNSQGLVRNVIGHCLSSRGGGYIFFGSVYDSSRMSWIPFSSLDSKHYSAGPAELVCGGWKTGVEEGIKWKAHKVAPDDQTLPICWHGRRPFKSIKEVRKYFKPLVLSFTNGGRVKAQFEIPPEAYLIISNLGNVCLGILNGSEVGLGN
ncbi:Xylanase inhibitor, N-terminal [Sesbania bispinosa]|nr:Xylanase inhibitor, N-terminal [Sesbania bispinosa]